MYAGPNLAQQASQPSASRQPYAMPGPPSYPSPHAFSVPQTSQPISQPGAMPPGGTVTQQGPLQEGDQLTHVVGSQGRRDILPSAPGRDGRFPCPSCTKTYMRAKNLRRHYSQHTGTRPYRCVLCNSTFVRSDVMNSHYRRCSRRRVTHLSLNGGLDNLGDMPCGYPMVPVDGLPNVVNDQMQRPSVRVENPGAWQPVLGSIPGRPGFEQHYNNVSSPMPSQQIQSYSMPPNQDGMPMHPGGGGSNE